MIDSGGFFIGPTGLKQVSNVNWQSLVGVCCTIVNGNFAIPAQGIDPIECPCCPGSFEYSSLTGNCFDVLTKQETFTVPCITCDCTPPPTFECGTCGTAGQPVTLSFNFFIKECTDCCPEVAIAPCGLSNFTAPIIYDPSPAGFKLTLSNYM